MLVQCLFRFLFHPTIPLSKQNPTSAFSMSLASRKSTGAQSGSCATALDALVPEPPCLHSPFPKCWVAAGSWLMLHVQCLAAYKLTMAYRPGAVAGKDHPNAPLDLVILILVPISMMF